MNVSSKEKEISVYFDPPDIGKFEFKLSKKGEFGTEVLKLDRNKQSTQIEINKKKRTKIDLVVAEDITNYVVEGYYMKLKTEAYPYPVLSPDTSPESDYLETEFACTLDVKKKDNDGKPFVNFAYRFILSNEEISL